MLFVSPMALVVKPVSTVKAEYGGHVFSRVIITLTENHHQPHAKTRNKFHECKAYMKRPWFCSTKNVCLPRDLESNGVLSGLHLLKPEC